MLLALFLIDLAAGLTFFSPSSAGATRGEVLPAHPHHQRRAGALLLAGRLLGEWGTFRLRGLPAIALTLIVYGTLRYPKRLIFRIPPRCWACLHHPSGRGVA